MEYENKYASKGVAGTGLGLGIAGTALGVVGSGILRNFGGLGNSNGVGEAATIAAIPAIASIYSGISSQNACSEQHTVNRYEAAQAARIAELETEVKLRDANTYTDSKLLDMYQYVDGRLRGIESQLCDQRTYNATNTATIGCIANQVNALLGLTKMVIPADNVCPEPMPAKNSWTAPTTAA